MTMSRTTDHTEMAVATLEQFVVTAEGNKYQLVVQGVKRRDLVVLTLVEGRCMRQPSCEVTPERLLRFFLLCALVENEALDPAAMKDACVYALRNDDESTPGETAEPFVVTGIGRGVCAEFIELVSDVFSSALHTASAAADAAARRRRANAPTPGEPWRAQLLKPDSLTGVVVRLFRSCRRLASLMQGDGVYHDAVALINALCIMAHVYSLDEASDSAISPAAPGPATDPSWETAHSYMRYFRAYASERPTLRCVNTECGDEIKAVVKRLGVRYAFRRAQEMQNMLDFSSALWVLKNVLDEFKEVAHVQAQIKSCERMMWAHSQAPITASHLAVGHQHTPWVVPGPGAVVSLDAAMPVCDAFAGCPRWIPHGFDSALWADGIGMTVDIMTSRSQVEAAAASANIRSMQ